MSKDEDPSEELGKFIEKIQTDRFVKDRRELMIARTRTQIEKEKAILDEIKRIRYNKSRPEAPRSKESVPWSHPSVNVSSTKSEEHSHLSYIRKAIELGMLPKPLPAGTTNATFDQLLSSYFAKMEINKAIGTELGARGTRIGLKEFVEINSELKEMGLGVTSEEILAYQKYEEQELITKARVMGSLQTKEPEIKKVQVGPKSSTHRSQIRAMKLDRESNEKVARLIRSSIGPGADPFLPKLRQDLSNIKSWTKCADISERQVTVKTDYTMPGNVFAVFADANSRSIIITLPKHHRNSYVAVYIERVDRLSKNAVTIAPAGDDTINGLHEIVFSGGNAMVFWEGESGEWSVLAAGTT